MTVISEIEILESLDFDPDLKCFAENCDSKAVWHTIVPCCNKESFVCDPCKVRWEEKLAHTLMAAKRFHCVYCLANVPDPMNWVVFTKI